MMSFKREPVFVGGRKARRSIAGLGGVEAAALAGAHRFHVSYAGGLGRWAPGFTMIELIVTLAVAVVLVIVAMPSFNSLILSNKLTTTANDMVAAINSARIEAVKRNAATQFCANTASANATGAADVLGTACGVQTGAVYLLPSPASNAAVQVLAAAGGLTAPLQLKGGTAVALRFNGQGLAQQVGAATLFCTQIMDICTSSISTNNHRQITMVAGSTLQTTSSSGTCP